MDGARGVARAAGVLIALGAAGLAGAANGTLEAAAADHAARAVLLDLGLSESPVAADYEIAALMLEIISELAPGDAELARLEAAAAFGTGDPRLLAAATSRLVSLDPSDTVAQLRLITARIASRQTAESRLEVYERFLGPAGVSVDPTIRSRLALDAALIYRERGDLDNFVRTLTLSVDLDRTNKEALHLATSYFAGFSGDDAESLAGLLEMQLALMWSDPIDPNVHLGIARMLAIEGATREASRFHENGLAILSAAGLMEPRHIVEGLALQWLLDGPRAVLDRIERDLLVARDNARLRFEQDKQRDVPERLLVPPEDVFLDPLYEKVRVIAAMDAQDGKALQAGLRELDAYARFQYRKVQEATKLDDEKSRERAFRQFADTVVSIQFMRALANVDMRTLVAQVPALPQVIGEEEWKQIQKPLEAWIALRAGDLETTRAFLSEIGAGTSIMRVCRAELLVAEGKPEEAAREYEFIQRNEPYIPYGAWARSRAMELTGRTDPITPAGRLMRRMVAEVPASLDQALRDPASIMSMKVDEASLAFEPGERAWLRVSMTNLTPWPLSLGPNRTISSRVLLGVFVDDADRLVSSPQPVVVDLDRRLRIESGETVTVEARVEQGINGMIFDSADRGVIRMRWQGWQAPTLDGAGAYVAGPYSLSDSTEKFARGVRAEGRLGAEELARAIREAQEPAALVAAVEGASAWLRRGDAPGAEQVVAALVERYAGGHPVERSLLIAALPNASHAPAMSAFDGAVLKETGLEAVRQDETPRVLAALTLLTRVRDADSALLDAARESGDRFLSRLAMLLEERLAGKRPSYAAAGPGVESLAGASKMSLIRGGRSP